MGLLAGTIPASTTADDVITYNGNTYNASATGEKWTRLTAKCTTTTWNASTTFTSSTNKPYKYSSTLYYIGKPADATIAMSATAGTQLYAWSASGSNTTITTANQYKTFTIATPDYSNAYNKKVWEFSYSGTGQQWVAPVAGIYTMECWGANGGPTPKTDPAGKTLPGIGGYTKGKISLTLSKTLYIYVGQVGYNSNSAVAKTNYGGWNGGGASGYNTTAEASSGGGGSTDIRLVRHTSGTWGCVTTTNTGDASLYSRIMVAGGGGGCGYITERSNSQEIGGCGGGLIGEPGSVVNNTSYNTSDRVSVGGTQTSSPTQYAGDHYADWYGQGAFGFASQRANPNYDCWGGGGGGGWYGSQKGTGNGGGGGSSFISGHPGCNGVNNSTKAHLGASQSSVIGGTTYTFTNTEMIDGDGYKWTSASETREYSSATVPGLPKIGSTTATKTTVPTKPTQTNANNGFCVITLTK